MSTAGVFAQRGNSVRYLARSDEPTATAIQALTSTGQAPGYDFTFTNFGPATAFIGVGASRQEAIDNAKIPKLGSSGTLCFVLPPGQRSIEASPTAWFAAITAAGSADLFITPGKGPVGSSSGVGLDLSGKSTDASLYAIQASLDNLLDRLGDLLAETRVISHYLNEGFNLCDDLAQSRADAALV